MIAYNLIENETMSGLGIDNTALDTALSHYNVFYNVQTLYSGGVSHPHDVTNTQSMLRSPQSNRYELIATANIIDIDQNIDVGAMEYYYQKGTFTSDFITSDIDRYYKTVTIDFVHPENTKQVLSEVFVGFMHLGKSTIAPNTILIDSETIDSATITLPVTVIADNMQFFIQLVSYTPGRSPYVSKATLSW